jgi:hypothetical protein
MPRFSSTRRARVPVFTLQSERTGSVASWRQGRKKRNGDVAGAPAHGNEQRGKPSRNKKRSDLWGNNPALLRLAFLRISAGASRPKCWVHRQDQDLASLQGLSEKRQRRVRARRRVRVSNSLPKEGELAFERRPRRRKLAAYKKKIVSTSSSSSLAIFQIGGARGNSLEPRKRRQEKEKALHCPDSN